VISMVSGKCSSMISRLLHLCLSQGEVVTDMVDIRKNSGASMTGEMFTFDPHAVK
jgi:hypothetical protein